MFDMSFSEIAVIGVVALVVLGPERLPKVARSAGHLFGRLQRYVATVKADINREMDTSELAKIKQEVQDAAKSFEHSVQQSAHSLEKETAAISQSVDLQTGAAEPPVAPMSAQESMLLEQDTGLREGVAAKTDVDGPAVPATLARTNTPANPGHSMQGRLDLGIEPVRAARSP